MPSDRIAPRPSHRLARHGRYAVLHGALGDVVLRPWFDVVALYTVAHWYLPLSRAWAAAQTPDARGGDLSEAFVRRVAAGRTDYDAAEAAWRADLFGRDERSAEHLLAATKARQEAAQRHMTTRGYGVTGHLRRRFPGVRWQVPRPDVVEAAQGARLAGPEAAFPAPEVPAVERSRALPGPFGREYWLRFRAPVSGDTAWAHVYEPEGAVDPPSLIFLHGIGMETEFWQDLEDNVSALAAQGLRVIRPEGPWHGRRRPEGWYGGEPAIATAPLGLIELFQAWAAEVAVLTAWARAHGSARVGLSGVSLGSLTSQMIAVASARWPAAQRLDALLLVATTGDMMALAESGSLSRALGLWPAMEAAGWSHAALDRWRPLLEPAAPPGLPPDRIWMLLGATDDLTPFAGGLELARRWGVPAENLFRRRQGHFSVSLGLARDAAPLVPIRRALVGEGSD
jgi:pimeloyl-ACP methyl ester carboxylesterase